MFVIDFSEALKFMRKRIGCLEAALEEERRMRKVKEDATGAPGTRMWRLQKNDIPIMKLSEEVHRFRGVDYKFQNPCGSGGRGR